MTAAQLIAALQAYPPDARVLIDHDYTYGTVENVTPAPDGSVMLS